MRHIKLETVSAAEIIACKKQINNIINNQQQVHSVAVIHPQLFALLNKIFISSTDSGVHRIIELFVNDDGAIDTKLYKANAFRSAFCNKWYDPSKQGGKRFNPYLDWLDSKDRKEVSQVVFNPDPSYAPSEPTLNLWQGFPKHQFTGMDENALFILDHIKKYLVSDSEDSYNFFIAWLAHKIQYPHIKLGTMVHFFSKKTGTGKGLLFRCLERVFGKNNCLMIAKQNDLTGTHNTQLFGKLLVSLDELPLTGGKSLEALVRNMITEPTMSYEHKGMPSKTVNSYHQFMGQTNIRDSLAIHSNERRFALFESTFPLVGEEKARYFEKLTAAVEDPIAASQLFHYLNNFNVASYNLREAPLTKEARHVLTEQQSDESRWLHEILSTGSPISFELKKPTRVTNEIISATYDAYCNEFGVKPISMRKLISFLVVEVNAQRKKCNGVRVLEFPSLELMRELYKANHAYLAN